MEAEQLSLIDAQEPQSWCYVEERKNENIKLI